VRVVDDGREHLAGGVQAPRFFDEALLAAEVGAVVTYSVLMQKLAPDSVADFIRAELDKVALAHSTFTDDALSLIVRSSEGVLRRARNLCLSALLETVRDRTK
jgi:hypothetical protein